MIFSSLFHSVQPDKFSKQFMSLQWPIIVEAKQKQFYTHEINTITSVLFISLRIKPVNQSKQSSTAYIHFCTNFPIMHFPLTSDPKYNFLLYLRVVSNAIERLVILIRMIIENLNYFRLILLFPFVGFEVSQSGNIHQYFHPFRRLIFYYCTRTFRGVIYI